MSDRDIVYGMVNYWDERPEARDYFDYILSDIFNIRTRYIRLGFLLRKFAQCEYFKDFGYSSLAEFCEVNLHLGKSALSRCLAVYDRFSAVNDGYEYRNDIKTKRSAISIGKKWEGFSYSQLCEMVSMDKDLLEQVTPDMTISRIRELKKKDRELAGAFKEIDAILNSRNQTPDSPPDVSQVATSQQGFDFGKFFSLHGASRSVYVNHVASSRTVSLVLFDESGTLLFNGALFDVLYFHDNGLVLRARPSESNASGQP